MKVLILGASGFVGRQLYRIALEARCDVIPVAKEIIRDDPGFVRLDISHEPPLRRLIKKYLPDTIFHVAGSRNDIPMHDLWQTYIVTTKQLLDICRTYSPKSRVVLVGSAAEYGRTLSEKIRLTENSPLRPFTDYGVVKAAQLMLRFQYRNDLSIVAGRPFNITGPGEPPSLVCASLVQRMMDVRRKKNNVIQVINGHVTRDFVDVRDVASALWQIGLRGEDDHVYNICTTRKRKISDVVEQIRLNMQVKRKIVYADNPQALTINCSISNKKISEMIGWKPLYTFKESMRDLVHDLKFSKH